MKQILLCIIMIMTSLTTASVTVPVWAEDEPVSVFMEETSDKPEEASEPGCAGETEIDYTQGLIQSAAERYGVTLPQLLPQISPASLFPDGNSPNHNWKVMPSEGEVKTISIILEFPDHAPKDTSYKRSRAQSSINAVGRHYKEASYGKMNLTGDVYYYLSSGNYSDYKSQVNGHLIHEIVIKEALLALEAEGVDFSKYDGNQDGYIDGLYIKVANRTIGFESNPLRHAFVSGLSSIETSGIKIGGKIVSTYAWIPIGEETWTDIHETGHLLGLADHYYALGLGGDAILPPALDDVMTLASGRYHNIVEKYLLGWVEPVVVSRKDAMREIDLYRQELVNPDGPQAVIIVPDESKLPFTEFYMLEYREKNHGVYLWHADTTLNSDNHYAHRNRHVQIVYASGDELSFQISKDLYTEGRVFSSATYPTSDFYDNIFTGIYMETLETHEDYARVKVGFGEKRTDPPQIIKTSMENNATISVMNFDINITLDTSFGLYSDLYDCIKNAETGQRVYTSATVMGNVLRLRPWYMDLERGAAYELVLPAGAIRNSSGVGMNDFRLRFYITDRTDQPPELKQIAEVEPPSSTLGTTLATADGANLVLSDVMGEWLGYTYPRLAKNTASGFTAWSLDLEGATADIQVTGFENETTFYAKRGGRTLRYTLYAEDEDTDAAARVTANYDSARYRTPIEDLTLSVDGQGYDIYYTLDGANPIYEGTKYNGPIALERSCTLKAVSVKDGVYSRALEKRYVFTKETGGMNLYSMNYDPEKLIIGLCSDRSLKIAEHGFSGGYDFTAFTDIVQVDLGFGQILGLKADGTVVSTVTQDPIDEFRFDVSGLTDVVQIVAEVGAGFLYALKDNGTVQVVRSPYMEERNASPELIEAVSNWEDIVQIAIRDSGVAGLRSDGTVVTCAYTLANTGIDWENMISIISFNGTLFGLTKDGKAVFEKNSFTEGKYENEWDNIVELYPQVNYMLGIDQNGNALATALPADSRITDEGQTDLSDWKGMEKGHISANSMNTEQHYEVSLGIQKNGGIVAKGNLQDGLYDDIQDWNLLVPEQIALQNKDIDLCWGEECNIQATRKGIQNRGIHWVSSDPSVVRVEQNGTVRALKDGTATITARADADPTVFDTCEVSVFINDDTDVSIHGDYSVTNWKVEENILSFTITNLTGTAKRPQLLLAEYAGNELTNIRTLPIPLAENDGSQNVTQVVPRNTKVFLWDGLNPIIDIPVVYQYV